MGDFNGDQLRTVAGAPVSYPEKEKKEAYFVKYVALTQLLRIAQLDLPFRQ